LEAEKAADQLVNDVNAAITGHEVKGKELKKEAAAQRKARAQIEVQGSGLGLDKGKGKAPARGDSPSVEGQVSEDEDDGDLPRTAAGEEYSNKKRALQQRLRECYLTLHRIKFLQGDIYHALGETKAAEEDAAYAVAEDLRRRLLRSECPDCFL
jgi:E3 ubiquitin-protein ligase SHPRH